MRGCFIENFRMDDDVKHFFHGKFMFSMGDSIIGRERTRNDNRSSEMGDSGASYPKLGWYGKFQFTLDDSGAPYLKLGWYGKFLFSMVDSGVLYPQLGWYGTFLFSMIEAEYFIKNLGDMENKFHV